MLLKKRKEGEIDMGYDRNKMIAQMEAWVGCKESDGSHEKIIDIYNSHTPRARGYKLSYSDPWCAGTVSAAAIATGCADIFPLEVSCSKMIEKAKSMGIWNEDDAYVPIGGEAVMYDWDDDGKGDCTGSPEHVGLAIKVVNGIIYVVEGNYNDAAMIRKLAVNGRYIRGFVVPKYDSSDVSPSGSKSILEVAKEVIAGKWGNGAARRQRLAAAGYNSTAVQAMVNDLLRKDKEDETIETPCKYEVGKVYTLTSNMKVRTGPGTDYRWKDRSELTADGKKHSFVQTKATLKKGTRVTCQKVVRTTGGIWLQIPSGYVCAELGNNVYVR